ncbi:hypothetical protein [Streptomyces rugosispiralis]|uniref:SpdA protein n=1 Tax=Streptomyces rugosispiralis TaxID=2967341 RepID=A0ABT1VF70_9ACTN|nr:hypothetical protein [Streptomyces rugosispiralis]MCQ8195435.1 hypothetical protein [Streptomyces rugosispiralis]
MSDEIRDQDGARLCEWCGGPIKQPATGRQRRYCRQSCRQRAYEERQVQERVALAKFAVRSLMQDEINAARTSAFPVSSRDDAAHPTDSSRDGSGRPEDSSRDGTEGAEDSSRDESVGSVPEQRPQRSAKASAPSSRSGGRGRRLWDVSPDEAEQVPLFGRPHPSRVDGPHQSDDTQPSPDDAGTDAERPRRP